MFREAKLLPDRPSDLILLGLECLEKCERDPYVDIDMDAMCMVSERYAVVCFIGAIMLKHLPRPVGWRGPYRWYHDLMFWTKERPPVCAALDPVLYDRDEHVKLQALNMICIGQIGEALEYLDQWKDAARPYYHHPSLECLSRNDLAKWKQEMRLLAENLRATGL